VSAERATEVDQGDARRIDGQAQIPCAASKPSSCL